MIKQRWRVKSHISTKNYQPSSLEMYTYSQKHLEKKKITQDFQNKPAKSHENTFMWAHSIFTWTNKSVMRGILAIATLALFPKKDPDFRFIPNKFQFKLFLLRGFF